MPEEKAHTPAMKVTNAADLASEHDPAPVGMPKLLDAEEAPKIAQDLGLTLEEYEMVCTCQGRVPSLTELTIYSLMWSEHCGYKHSKNELKKFPTEGDCVMQGPGENAGVIGLGEGWALSFKAESHNHPSAIEPYQGAATGVGGIVRDIFAMGARPVASLNSLRFGSLEKPRQRYLLDGAVAGIGGYGNCLGVPTVGGEIYFDDCYEGNCLIDVMCLGLMRVEDLQTGAGAGVGNHLVLFGSTTGRDGIGGASTLASQEFDEAAENKRPAVQVGDPFEEKLLVEVCLELLHRGLFVALGDLGAAGISSAASEMASSGGVGLDIEVDRVPQREPEMTPAEIMASESQERMLAVVTPENLAEVQATCARWGVLCTVIGEVTDTKRFVIRQHGEIVADIPAAKLADDAPRYSPAYERPDYLDELQGFDPASLEHPAAREGLERAFLELMAEPNIASKRWIYEQYDYQVQDDTAVLPGEADAAVLRVGMPGRGPVSSIGVAVSTDCNSRYCHVDPREGAKIALIEGARNVACTGATPAAITNCLNFGNPDKPEVFYVFREAVEGLAEACREMGTPVTGGNVSLYNESFGQAIWPTPMVGMVGTMPDYRVHATMGFEHEGDIIVLLGETADELGASQYLATCHGVSAGRPPKVDFELERGVEAATIRLIREGYAKSAHDCSEGGLAVALAECCIAGGHGCMVTLDDELSPVASLFSETQSRVILTVSPDDADVVADILDEAGIPYDGIGRVRGHSVTVLDESGTIYLDVPVERAADLFDHSIERLLAGEAGTSLADGVAENDPADDGAAL